MRLCILTFLVLLACGGLQAQPEPEPFPFDTMDVEALLATVVGEARGQRSANEIAAIVHVIYNRWQSKRWGNTLRAVVYARNQFSCWNDNDPNRSEIETWGVGWLNKYSRIQSIALATLRGRVNGTLVDPTYQANYYWHPKAMRVKGQAPYWSAKFELCVKIGDGVFCRIPA
jgi:spore germination cell wall hydrolase CwlJ-like protein